MTVPPPWHCTVWDLLSVCCYQNGLRPKMSAYHFLTIFFRPCCWPCCRWIHRPDNWNQMGIYHDCKYVCVCFARRIRLFYLFLSLQVTCGACGSIGIPLLRETYGPVIRLRRVAKYVDTEMAARAHAHLVQERGSKLHVLWINLSRPIYLLTHSLICFILSLYVAL